MVKNIENISLILFLHITLLYNISQESPIIGDAVELVDNDEYQKNFAFVASIGDFSKHGVHRKLDGHNCGGVLISKRHVLTAAHCLRPKTYYGTLVTFGASDLNLGWSYDVKSWITYASWAQKHGINYSDEKYYDDIGLITLSSDVHGIKPAVITKLSDHDIFDKEATLLGWGRIFNGKSRTVPLKLQKAYLHVLNITECERRLERLPRPENTVKPNEYCTISEPPMILGCGDSGSPLLLISTNEIIGISSAVCGPKSHKRIDLYFSVHIKVRLYETFINDVVNSP